MLKILLIIILNINATTLVKIADKEITKKDFEKFKKEQHEGKYYLSPFLEFNKEKISLVELINLELVSLDIERSNFKETEEAKQAMKIALINQYLHKNVYREIENGSILNKEITDYYKTHPVMKLFRLTIPYDLRISDNYKKVYSLLTNLRSDLSKKRITPQEALKRANIYGNEIHNGVFDEIFWDELTNNQREALQDLEPGEISSLIDSTGMIEIIQLIKKYPISNQYTNKIKQFIKIRKAIDKREAFFEKLRKKYKDLIKTNI